MNRYTVKADFITEAGLRAAVVLNDELEFHCGYVGVPSGHPIFGVNYPDRTLSLDGRAPEDVFKVHGGLTYADGKKDYPVDSDLWWFGYDCGHYGDASKYSGRGVFRDLDYCKQQCESLARQLADTIKPT